MLLPRVSLGRWVIFPSENDVVSCSFQGPIALRKGEIVKITRAFPASIPVRVAELENMTSGEHRTSRDAGVFATVLPVQLTEPIVGRVMSSSAGGNDVTYFELDDGDVVESVFVRAGELRKGREAIISILERGLTDYLKLMDTWVSGDTVTLLAHVPRTIEIFILSENVLNPSQLENDARGLGVRMSIKTSPDLHDRFILTRGEGWHIGHALKDFGKKISLLTKLPSSTEEESEFDDLWVKSVQVLRT